MTDPRRAIPAVDRLMADPALDALTARWPRARVVAALRASQDEARASAEAAAALGDPADPAAWARRVEARLRRAEVPSLRPVLNGTGVVLHTNLGRAPLAPEALEAAREAGAGYTNLEFDLERGGRGSRYTHCVDLLVELLGGEDAVVVNNCAAALMLSLDTVARGRGVAVSRGELVEIGGGFRIPEILARSGAGLVEVGTTNRTRVADYEAALEAGGVAALLKVHRSNFRISGFTEEATVPELVGLAREREVPLVHDLGSGLVLDAARLGLPAEPTAADSLAAGADLVAVSGDKLLGGPQAGILVGRAEWIARVRANPLCRALRPDKLTLAALAATLRLYRDPEAARERIPALRMLTRPADEVRARAEELARGLSGSPAEAAAVPSRATVGGGTCPGVEIDSWAVRVEPPDGDAQGLAARLRAGDPPLVGRIEDDAVLVDLRTVDPAEDETVAGLLRAALGPRP